MVAWCGCKERSCFLELKVHAIAVLLLLLAMPLLLLLQAPANHG